MLNKLFLSLLMLCVSILATPLYAEEGHVHSESAHDEEQERGPHNGRMLHDEEFAIEVTVYEQGVPPQFRVYAYDDGEPVPPTEVDLSIQLTRLDGEVNRFAFLPEEDVLVAQGTVAEPHSFDMQVSATYKGKLHKWKIESYEGRTRISDTAATEAGVETEAAGEAVIRDTIRLTGRITLNRDTTAQVRARFPGIVRKVHVTLGEKVKKGQLLATVESNDSLRDYSVVSPTDGTVLTRNTNTGDVAGDAPLFTIADLSQVWAEFHVFPQDLAQVNEGQLVRMHALQQHDKKTDTPIEAPIAMLLPTADALSQTVVAIVPLANPDNLWRPGMAVEGDVLVAEKTVPLAVRKSALQRFRDFTVVFAKYGETYEVRMLELGQQDDEWAEVLEGLKPGTEYVTQNSFLIKADIEKSGASHDH